MVVVDTAKPWRLAYGFFTEAVKWGARIAAIQTVTTSADHSFSEPHLSTDNELVRDILLALLSSLAKPERTKISERTKAGLERARAKGKRLGRSSFSAADRKKLIAALDTGKSWRAVSAATGIPFSTVQKHAQQLGYAPPGRVRENRHRG